MCVCGGGGLIRFHMVKRPGGGLFHEFSYQTGLIAELNDINRPMATEVDLLDVLLFAIYQTIVVVHG